jgi:translation initiation factor eIF-2B subunit delta
MKHSGDSLPRHVIEMLEAIESDNRSGAAELLEKAAAVYVAASDGPEPAPETSVLFVNSISAALRKAQPGMAGLLNLVREVETAVRRPDSIGPLALAARAASEFAVRASRNTTAVAALAAELIAPGAVILTHSRSSTVLAGLLEAARRGQSFSLIATESRPMLEGRQLAESASGAGVQVSMIVDSAAALVMDRVDLVLVGADRVTPELVLNKIGTRLIAMSAHDLGVPIYCLADTSKFIAFQQAAQQNPDPPGFEVWPDHPPGISIINRYFEEVPLALFTSIVTENGSISPSDASWLAANSR